MNSKSNKLVKILPFILYIILMAAQVYATFFVDFLNDSSRHYRLVLFLSLALSVLALPAAYLIWRKKESESAKKAAIFICCLLLLFQAVTLPVANIFSMTLPVWPPRGSVYQYPSLRESVSLNELPLFLSYYLDGKKLTANEADNPRDFDNGYLFLLDEYTFDTQSTMVLDDARAGQYKDNTSYYKILVQGDPKREIPGFAVYIYQGTDYSDITSFILYKDVEGNWYIVPAAEDYAL